MFCISLLPWTLKVLRTESYSSSKEEALGAVQSTVHKRGQQPVLQGTRLFMRHQMAHSKGIAVTSRDMPSLTQCPGTATL